jgi:O-antigen ligase
MKSSWLPVVVSVLAVVAGWGAARYALVFPLLFIGLLLATLALPPQERRLVDPRWLLAGGFLIGVSFVVAMDHELALRHTLLFLAAVFAFGLARRAPLSDAQSARLAALLALSGVVAVGQVVGGLERMQAAVTQLPEPWREAAMTRLLGGRAFGTAALPGHFAALMLLCLPLLTHGLWGAKGWKRAWWSALLLLAAGAMVLTRSLAAPLLAALLVALLARRRRRIWPVVAAALLVIASGAVVLASRHDLSQLEPLRLRWINWSTTAWVFVHHPWLGVGLGGVGQASLEAPLAAANITPYTHNTYLQLIAELGLAGAGLVVAGVPALARLLRRGVQAAPALAAAVAVVPLHNLIDFSAYAPEVLLPWAVLAGSLAGRVFPLPSRPVRSVVAVVLLGGGALLATLNWRSEVELDRLQVAPRRQAPQYALTAAAWAPWTVTPLELGAGLALSSDDTSPWLPQFEDALSSRAWVRPASSSWAEARARIALALGRRGEAVVWAREAHRRAPWRTELAELEARCLPPR